MPYGFRVVGPTWARRRLVDAAAAFAAYARLDDRADVHREAYLSAFTFGCDFRAYMDLHGTPRGFGGDCWSPFLWFDIDREGDLDAALAAARRLAAFILSRYGELADDDLLVFFSGSKGAHLGLPTSWGPPPGNDFHRVARRFAESLAAAAGVAIDTGVYDRVRLFRAPNTPHPKTGLHKRRLTLDELMHLGADRVMALAEPAPFDVPLVTTPCQQAALDWQAAEAALAAAAEERAARRRTTAGDGVRLMRATLDFIRDGAAVGDRHRRLFSAAANLAEFGCPPALAHALLTEAALDSGLPPKEVARQIDSGLKDGASQPGTPP
jgi:hypothetical protein